MIERYSYTIGEKFTMRIRGWASPLLLAVTVLVTFSLGLSAQQAPKQNTQKPDKTQALDIQTLVKLVDGVSAGQPAPIDIAFTFQSDFLKAQDNKTYVPYTLVVDPAKLPKGPITMYIRVVNRNPPPPPPPPAPTGKKDEKNAKPPLPIYAFEDVQFISTLPMQPATATGPAQTSSKIGRAFAVVAGDYDVYIAIKENALAAPPKDAPPAKMGVLKQGLIVPNFWTSDLTTSSVIVADKVEPLTAPLTREQQVEQPYTLGMLQILPSPSSRFTKKDELSTIFFVYNAVTDANKKPDVNVEYGFYQKAEAAEKFFNRTAPQAFNAQTLPPQWDAAAGHQINAGQSVPLASFPEGQYRLEIKVTDNLAKKTVTRDVTFTVAP